jgi:NAD(P)-dependent dehydrogenase (short-subunit alcohol dehydrogenase family)
MGVNLRSAFKLGQVLARLLREQPRPVGIVLLSSVAGLRGEPGGACTAPARPA